MINWKQIVKENETRVREEIETALINSMQENEGRTVVEITVDEDTHIVKHISSYKIGISEYQPPNYGDKSIIVADIRNEKPYFNIDISWYDIKDNISDDDIKIYKNYIANKYDLSDDDSIEEEMESSYNYMEYFKELYKELYEEEEEMCRDNIDYGNLVECELENFYNEN